MPFNNNAPCVVGECELPDFPTTEAACVCETAGGGINELYFIPCTEVFSEANLTDPAYWQGLIDAGTLGRSGLILGSIGKKSDKKDRIASCRTEQITQIVWALKAIKKCLDKTSARTTCAQMNTLINSFSKFQLVARMCDGAETILPVGTFQCSDFNWVVPENFEDNQQIEVELSWKELGMPCTVDVAGLAAVLPKLQ